jgi:hypothetical protein
MSVAVAVRRGGSVVLGPFCERTRSRRAVVGPALEFPPRRAEAACACNARDVPAAVALLPPGGGLEARQEAERRGRRQADHRREWLGLALQAGPRPAVRTGVVGACCDVGGPGGNFRV